MVSISVVVTCYNEEEYIGDSIRSVLDQTRYDLIDKIVVVNDGSEDNSEEVIREIQEDNPKVEYVCQDNEGLPGARNTGLERCTGDFVALQDGDDLWLEHKIERQAEVLRKYPDVGIVYSDFQTFGSGEKKRVSPNQFKYSDGNVLVHLFRKGGPIVPSTTVINRKCFSTVGTFDPDLLRGQDTDLWLRIAEEYQIHHVDEPLVDRRDRSDSLGKSHREKTRYLMRVTDKIAVQIPRLEPFVDERKAMTLATRGRKLLEEGERWEAVRMLKSAITYKPTSLEVLTTFVFVSMPLPQAILAPILKVARRARGTIQSPENAR
jgi:glycosyltransferase involved in cell wall biosynthesis